MITAHRISIDVPSNAYVTTCCVNGVGVLRASNFRLEREDVELRFTTAHIDKLEELTKRLKRARAAQLADNAAKARDIEATLAPNIDTKG